MSASLKIVRTQIAQWGVLLLSFFLGVVSTALAEPVYVNVATGDTSFVVDFETEEIWWITETCRHEIPVLDSDNKDKDGQTTPILSSDKFLKDVQIGSHRFTLEQQFRFEMVSQAPMLYVFNSARGGWSEVEIDVEETCQSDFSCRQRMELPLCVD